MCLKNNDYSGHQRSGYRQRHAHKATFYVEPIIVIVSGHIFCAGDNEMLVVAKPEAIHNKSIKPIHDTPESISRERSAPEGRAPVDIANQQTKQDSETEHGDKLLCIKDRAAGPIGIIHQAEGLATLNGGRSFHVGRVVKSGIFAIFVRFRVTPDGKSGIFRVFVRFRATQLKSVIHEGAKWSFIRISL